MPFLNLQGAFTAGELAPTLQGRVDLSKYAQGCKTLTNMLVQPHGGVVKRSGFKLLDELSGEAVLIPFVFNTSQAYCLVFGEKWLRIATADGFIYKNNLVYQIASPYTLAQAKKISYAQSADVLFLACSDIRPKKLNRLAHDNWVFEDISFIPDISPPSGHAIFANGAIKSDGTLQAAQLSTPYSYYVTAINAASKESGASAAINITGPPSNNWSAGDFIDISWSGGGGAVEYKVYKSSFGGAAGFIGSASVGAFRDYNIQAVSSDSYPRWKDPFANGDYPSVVCLFEQRLVFATSPNRPQTIWLSKSGDYDNFSASIPLKASDSIELTIASNEVSIVCWVTPLRSLVLGATGMEWELGSSEGAFTAKTAKVTPQSYRGSALGLKAIVVGDTVLHVTRSARQVRDLKYDFAADSYGGSDRTILAAHLFENHRIISWTYQPSPNSIIWCVRDDGILLALTFQAEHEIFAWHKHITNGEFKAVCSVPTGQDDTLFVATKRNNKYFLEVLGAEFKAGKLEDCNFLDCSLQYKGNPTNTVSGLSHLEGLTVGILADGASQTQRTVKNGAVTLDYQASNITVGLPFEAELETMPVEIQMREGNTLGRKKYINAVNVLFKDTVTAKIGCSFDRLEEVKWRRNEAYGTALSPFSGIHRVVVAEYAKNQATICIKSSEPLPMTVLALMPEVDVK